MISLALTALLLANAPTLELSADAPVSADGIWQLRLGDEGQPWREVRVPGNLPFQGITYDGVVWFRKTFTLPANWGDRDAALRLPMSANAFEIFLNGVRFPGRGVIGPGDSLVRKDFRAGVFRLPREHLVLQGSNTLELRLRTFYGNGGVMAAGTLLGPDAAVHDEHEHRMVKAAMLFALFVFAGFFHLVLFVGRRRERHHLSFAGVSLCLGAITAGINTLGYLLSDSPDFNAYLVFAPLLVLPYLLVRFFSEFFSREARLLRRVTLGFAVVALLGLFSSTLFHAFYRTFERVVLPLAIVTLAATLCLSLWWTISAVRSRVMGAAAILVGAMIYGLTSTLELMWSLNVIHFRVDSYLGFAVLVGSMVVAIASRFAWLHRQVEIGERDSLTGLLTRHGFKQRLEMVLDRHDQLGGELSCIMLDIDHFKQVNDQHGHAFGDTVLRTAGSVVRQALRSEDVVARWGGEEFLILLPEQGLEKAMEIAARIQNALRAARFEEKPAMKMTASFGVAARGKHESFDEWISRADRVLYDAKHAGRDCIRSAGAETELARA